ncbi:MAG: ATP-binding protein [Desulforegulaceae bacterium]|nr:ATP-binding protein [Desulforegulaceae bacterium]
MRIGLSLKFKVFFLLSIIVFMTFIWAVSIVSYSVKTDSALNKMVNENIETYKAAKNLENALSNQKGFLTYFFVDEEYKWLEELGKYMEIFQNELNQIKELVSDTEELELIEKIEKDYAQYIKTKDQAIKLYKSKMKESITDIHIHQRKMFFNLLVSCEKLCDYQWNSVIDLKQKLNSKAETMRKLTIISILFLCFIYLVILHFISKKILEPIAKIAEESGTESNLKSKNQIELISENLKGIKQLYANAETELTKSRESLEQSERLALVGKLAAGVAHSIRNPFTSVKMRLFSLSRSLNLSFTHEEDFQVISDEIGRIDNIIQNFLEFSRLPKLKMEYCHTYPIITSVIQLLEHRLKTYDVHTKYIRSRFNPVIFADADRIREALINIIINACEAMENGGEIEISEEITDDNFVKIKFKDSGPGISEEAKSNILNPFFTTKEYGSGLGLSIVHKIMAEHKGIVFFESEEGKGTVFILSFPLGEKKND